MSDPSRQSITADTLARRREVVFLVLAGLFFSTLTLLAVLGVSRAIVFASWSHDDGWAWGRFGDLSFYVLVGVLPYPMTFLCTDLISDFYGKRRANLVVLIGLLLYGWVAVVLYLGGLLPPVPTLDPATGLPPLESLSVSDQGLVDPDGFAFFRIRELAFAGIFASLAAYLLAQLCDVQLFHFWKRLTGGKHLWLRNNGSTLISQLVDSVVVNGIIFLQAPAALNIDTTDPARRIAAQLGLLIVTEYVFKGVAALLDTPVIYAVERLLKPYLGIDPAEIKA